MKNSLQHLISKLDENGSGQGFRVLKHIRGGNVDPSTNSGTECTNSATTCTGTNKYSCDNQKDCSGTTNSGTCTNGQCFD